MYDLSSDPPNLISELNDIEEIYDSETFQETGFKLVIFGDLGGEDTEDEFSYGYKRKSLHPSPLRNLVFETKNGD